jgi:hypothetical protein
MQVVFKYQYLQVISLLLGGGYCNTTCLSIPSRDHFHLNGLSVIFQMNLKCAKLEASQKEMIRPCLVICPSLMGGGHITSDIMSTLLYLDCDTVPLWNFSRLSHITYNLYCYMLSKCVISSKHVQSPILTENSGLVRFRPNLTDPHYFPTNTNTRYWNEPNNRQLVKHCHSLGRLDESKGLTIPWTESEFLLCMSDYMHG